MYHRWAGNLRFLAKVSDRGAVWEMRRLERLTKEIGGQSAVLAIFLGALRDAAGQTPARFLAFSSGKHCADRCQST